MASVIVCHLFQSLSKKWRNTQKHIDKIWEVLCQNHGSHCCRIFYYANTVPSAWRLFHHPRHWDMRLNGLVEFWSRHRHHHHHHHQHHHHHHHHHHHQQQQQHQHHHHHHQQQQQQQKTKTTPRTQATQTRSTNKEVGIITKQPS